MKLLTEALNGKPFSNLKRLYLAFNEIGNHETNFDYFDSSQQLSKNEPEKSTY